ncbi:cholecystokinin receptor type a [Plakobranchus ocellatus]|uniref:Cholecystokinin receptor type a n=1 Tax=Plakobranchus ocellatus TaxID=259542 RepID=A0AAV3Y6D2_9GAST|nr:cholecystokinin receptor type a [Plakobranchus ocellatus]
MRTWKLSRSKIQISEVTGKSRKWVLSSGCVSVAASCFTLVAISLERYFAICYPLKSRRWQTLSHSYKAIGVCWVCALALMTPIAVHHQHIQIGPKTHICREIWPDEDGLKTYTVMINLFLLVLPIFIMTWAYGCVSYTLWIGMKLEKKSEKESQSNNGTANYDSQNGVSIYTNNKNISTSRFGRGNNIYSHRFTNHASANLINNGDPNAISVKSTADPVDSTKRFRRFDVHRAMRQSNTERSRAAKKRVIKMLFIIVLEFFIFWTPVYILATWITFDAAHARQNISATAKSLTHLLSYVSACCNPITYCFMNKNFRQGFLMAFRCTKKRYVYANRSQMSLTSGVTNSTRAPVTPSTVTTYDKIMDSDDISENSF